MKRIDGLTKTAVMVGVLLTGLAFAGVIKTWTAGDVLTPSDLTSNFNHIHNLMVGGHGARLVDADVSATAAIQTSKLAAASLIPRAWAQMDSTCTSPGVCPLGDSAGVTSVVRGGSTGNYTVNLSSSRTTPFLCLVVGGLTGTVCNCVWASATTATGFCFSSNTAGTAADSRFSFIIMDN